MSSGHNHQIIVDTLEQALKQWHRDDEQIALDEVLPHLVRRARTTRSGNRAPTRHQVANQLLLDLLETLAETDSEAAALLRRRYIDDETGFAVANSLGISESAFYRRRREALVALAEIAVTYEDEVRSSHAAKLEKRLEAATYHQLFGVTDLQARLSELLHPQSDIKMVCLTGMGGIGKTALADSLAREAIVSGEFDDLAWVSARQQQFGLLGEIQETDYPAFTAGELIVALDRQLSEGLSPPRPAEEILSALKMRLGQSPHLIVLDNLETVADYDELFPLLGELSQFAWILLTSRVGVYEQPNVHITNLAELNPTDAAALVRDEAFRRGLGELAEAPPETMSQIYNIAGGNPLALKLIIGQVQVRSLSIVLADLNEARGRRVEALYEFIYRQAWDLLDDVARRVLLVMPLVAAPGGKLEQLVGVTGLADDDLYDALDLLIRLSLVTVGGPLDERRYQIHRLTETFLHKQVTKWA
jgi:hypothetical protein